MEPRDAKKDVRPKPSKNVALGGQLQNLLAEAEGLSLGLKESSRSSNPGQSRSTGNGSPLPSPRGTLNPASSSSIPLPSPRGGSKIGSTSRGIRSYEDVGLLELHEQDLVGPLYESIARCILLPMTTISSDSSSSSSSSYQLPREIRELREGKESNSDLLTRFAASMRIAGSDARKILKHIKSLDDEALLQLLELRYNSAQQLHQQLSATNTSSSYSTTSAVLVNSRRGDQPADSNELMQWCEAEIQRVRSLTQQLVEKRGNFQGKLVVKVIEAKGLDSLNNATIGSVLNSYCAIVVGDQRDKTDTKKKTSEPNWSKELTFKLSLPVTSFKVELHHKDKSKKIDTILSEIGVSLLNVEEEKEKDEWISFPGMNGTNSSTPAIHLHYKYTFKNSRYLRVVRGSGEKSSSSSSSSSATSVALPFAVSDSFLLYKLLLKLLLNSPEMIQTEGDSLFSEVSQWLLDEFALSYGIERSAQTLALLTAMYRFYRPTRAHAKSAMRLLQSEHFRLAYTDEQESLLALRQKFGDLIRGYLVDYSDHFASNLPAGAFGTHWQFFTFLSNNDPQKVRALLEQSRRAQYEKLAGKSASLRDLIRVCTELPALIEADASHFAPVLAPIFEGVPDVSATASVALYDHLRADVIRICDQQSGTDPDSMELLFAVCSLHERLEALQQKCASVVPSLASTSSILLSSSLSSMGSFLEMGNVFFPVILSWLRETSLQSTMWLSESQQSDSRLEGGAMYSAIPSRLIRKFEEKVEYVKKVQHAVREHPQANVLLLQLAEILCKSAAQFRRLHERLLAFHRTNGIAPQSATSSNKVGVVSPASVNENVFEEVSLASTSSSGNDLSSPEVLNNTPSVPHLSTIQSLLPLTPVFCTAVNNLEKFRSELDRLCGRMLGIVRENSPSQQTEMSRLAAGCVEESIGVCFRESTCALSDAVEAALKKILSEMRDSLCAVVVTLLKKSQYDAQIVRKWVTETGRELDLTSMHFSRAFFDRAFLTPIRAEAAKIFTEVLLSPLRADVAPPLSKSQLEILKKLFTELLGFFNEREAAGALVTAKALAHNGDDVSELLSLSERTTPQLIEMHTRLESGHNPYKLTAEAERELELAGYCVQIAKTRSNVDLEAKQFLETLAKNHLLKQQKKDALANKMKEIRTYFGFAESEFLLEEYSCSAGWLYLTNQNLGFYPMIGVKLLLPLKEIAKVNKESNWLIETLKIQTKNGDVHAFKGPLRGEPAADLPLRLQLLGFDVEK